METVGFCFSKVRPIHEKKKAYNRGQTA